MVVGVAAAAAVEAEAEVVTAEAEAEVVVVVVVLVVVVVVVVVVHDAPAQLHAGCHATVATAVCESRLIAATHTHERNHAK